jgi:hypothetical protein
VQDDLNKQVYQRVIVLHELMDMEGVPADIVTAVAMMSLGIKLHYDLMGNVERLAVILEQWAAGIRQGQYLADPVTELKRRKDESE